MFICSLTYLLMKKIICLFAISLFLTSCNTTVKSSEEVYFQSVIVDTIVKDNFSVRGILFANQKVWYASNNGIYGNYDFGEDKKFQAKIKHDSLNLEFRSIAENKRNIFLLSIGSPALLYSVSKNGPEVKLVYEEKHKKAFYDSMQFWNDKEGIAMGDPTDSCFSIIITRDGGETWQKSSCDDLPKIEEGEAAFAASNTNIVIKDNKTWIVSGGKKAHILYSQNKGKSWEIYKTPIVHGEPMTGIFSADFYDENIGFLVGGNYEKPEQNFGNKALTINGGKTWTLIAENSGFGYASCVQFVPDSGGKQLVTVGHSGLNYSSDNGTTWKQFLKTKDLYTIRFIDKNTAIAAGKNNILRIKFKK